MQLICTFKFKSSNCFLLKTKGAYSSYWWLHYFVHICKYIYIWTFIYLKGDIALQWENTPGRKEPVITAVLCLLQGLHLSVCLSLASAAAEKGKEGEWMFSSWDGSCHHLACALQLSNHTVENFQGEVY